MKKEVKKLKTEVQDVLENNILNFWLNRMVDEENGGFYGRIDGNGVLHPDAEKGAILNARILWAFSASYRVMGKPEYLEAATRAKRYIIDHFIDQEAILCHRLRHLRLVGICACHRRPRGS